MLTRKRAVKTGLTDPGSAAWVAREAEAVEYAWHVGQECFMVKQAPSGVIVLRMDEKGVWWKTEAPNVALGLALELLRVATLRPELPPPVLDLADDIHLADPLSLLEELQHRYSDENMEDADRDENDPKLRLIRSALEAVARTME